METSIDIQDEKLADDLWLLHRVDTVLAFAPLRGKVFPVKPKGLNALRSFFAGNSDVMVEQFLDENGLLEKVEQPQAQLGKPYTPTSLVLSLTSGCNLSCVYCYATAVSNGVKMPIDIAKSAIDIATSEARKKGTQEFSVLFHGGGEALTEWKILQVTTEYVESVWEGAIRFNIVTNGTLITPKRADWFKEHKFNFTVSLDGPEDIQNVQRPMINGRGSYKACCNGIRLLKERDIPCAIRATITAENVHRMDEMVVLAAELGCMLKVEPITQIGRGKTGNNSVSAIDFVNAFQLAQSLAKKLGVKLTCSYLPKLKPNIKYCAADGEMFLLLPTGEVSCCSRVTKQEDELSEVFFIGKIEAGQAKINTQRVDDLRKLHIQQFSQCTNCFAKWHCAGGCHNTRLASNGNMPKDHCDLSRWLLWSQLLDKSH